MVQVQVRIEMDGQKNLTMTLDVLRREDARDIEKKLADMIEAQVKKTFGLAADMVGAPITVRVVQ